MKGRKGESGLLSLEASIAVTIFLFLMLFLYSLFIVFEARNEMAHVLLAATDSLALDPYENKRLEDTDTLADFLHKIYKENIVSQNGFTDSRLWNEYTDLEKKKDEVAKEKTAQLEDVVRKRFVAYLADGDEEAADALLKRYHIVGGVQGLDFSGTHIEGDKLFVKVRYTLEYEFHVFNLSTLTMEQSACSKIWTDEEKK